MRIKTDALGFSKMHIAAACAIAATILLWAYFLNATTISVNDLFTFKFQILLEKIISINFALFIITFPLPSALLAAFAKKMQKTSLMIAALLATAIALIIAMIAFERMQGFWLLGIFYIIAVPLQIETAFIKYGELKKFVTMRTMLSAAGRCTTLIAIGLVVLSAVTLLPQQEQYVERFEETFFENIFTGFTTGETQQQLSSSVADIIIESQQKTIESMITNPLFEKLRGKTDQDVIAFVTAADAVKEQIASQEYRQQVAAQVAAGGSTATKNVNIMQVLRERLPFITTLEKFMWLIHGSALASVFLFIASIAIKPLAAAYGLIAEKALSLAAKAEK
jgi:hypothetical protein